MEDIVSQLSQSFPNYTFEYGKAPSYISSILPIETDIITCYKFIKVGPSVTISSSNVTSPEEITGQPLEAPYGANETLNLSKFENQDDEEESLFKCHGPICIMDARKIINMCNMKLNPNCPVWILTSSADNQVLLSCFKKDGWLRRSNSFSYMPDTAPSINDYVTMHRHESSHIKSMTEANVKCSQVLLQKKSFYSNGNHIKITLVLNWNELKTSPPRNAKTSVNISCTVGHGCTPLNVLWKQILLLHDYLEIIKNNPEDTMYQADLPGSKHVWDSFEFLSSAASENIDFNKKIKELVQDTGRVFRVPSKDKLDILKTVKLVSAPWRLGCELLDNMWTLFIGSTSTQQLFSLFKLLFVEVDTVRRMGKTFHHGTNSISRLAVVLDGYGISPFNLNPLKDLVELGIDKLRKEMLLIFSSLKIISLASLEVPSVPKFSELKSDQWLSITETWLTWIGRIFTVLEILSNFQEVPIFKEQSLSDITSALLSQLAGPKSTIESLESLINSPQVVINFPLPICHVKTDMLNSNAFDEWCLTLSTKAGNSGVTSVFFHSLKNVIPDAGKDDDITEDIGEVTILSKTPHDFYIKSHFYEDKLF